MSDLDATLKIARDLGEAIVSHSQVQAFLNAQRKLRDDQEAQQLLQEYQQVAEKIQQLQQTGQPIEPADKQQLSACEGRMASQDTLKEMMRAQADYHELMTRVNQEIETPLARAMGAGPASE